MNRIKLAVLIMFAWGSVTAFAGKDSAFKVQNSVRVGYDDNIYQSSANEEDSAFITDILHITGDLLLSDRSTLNLYWRPEFRYVFDQDPEFVSYQNLYARLDHELSARTSLSLSDRFRYQDREGQSDFSGGAGVDQNFLENEVQASLRHSLNQVNQITVGGGYEFRVWDDDNYGEWNPGTNTRSGNNYDLYSLNGSYTRVLNANTTYGVAGVTYSDLEYDGDRGGFDSTTLYGGVDHSFNPNVLGSLQAGLSFSTVESSDGLGTSNSDDNTTPYLQAGLDYQASERTKFNSTLSYSLAQSENSIYNASESVSLLAGVKHDLTGKIALSGTLSYVFSSYDSAYSSFGYPDADENFVRLSLRGSYEITRNHFVDLGYEISDRDSDSIQLQEYTRNRVDLGWRLLF